MLPVSNDPEPTAETYTPYNASKLLTDVSRVPNQYAKAATCNL